MTSKRFTQLSSGESTLSRPIKDGVSTLMGRLKDGVSIMMNVAITPAIESRLNQVLQQIFDAIVEHVNLVVFVCLADALCEIQQVHKQ